MHVVVVTLFKILFSTAVIVVIVGNLGTFIDLKAMIECRYLFVLH